MTDNEEIQAPMSNDELEEIVEEETDNSVEKRPKKGYVMTDKRREALERGRKVRSEKVKIRQEEKALTKAEEKKYKAEAKARKVLGISNSTWIRLVDDPPKDELDITRHGVTEGVSPPHRLQAGRNLPPRTPRPQAELEAELVDSDSEEEVIVRRKKKPVAKKKKIVYIDESSEDEEPKSVERVRRKTYSDREMRELIQEPEPKVEAKPFRLKRV